MSQEVISKETIYNGYRFRSRLEARWAVFFDKLRIPYQYEPEAFVCEDGSQYTPDFFLPESHLRNFFGKGLYLEIKHFSWNDPSQRQYIDRIATALPGKNLVLICGEPADAIEYNLSSGNEQLCPEWDNYMGIQYCEKCRVLKAEFWESNYMYCPCCKQPTSDEMIGDAALSARQFRFQFHK